MTTKVKIILIVVGAFVLLVIGIVGGRAWRGYKADKEYQQYQKDKAEWDKIRAVKIAEAEAAEKKYEEIKPQLVALQAIIDQQKNIDKTLITQIEEVQKNASEKETQAEQPMDCRDRAKLVCDVLRTNRIKHDCETITRENCNQ